MPHLGTDHRTVTINPSLEFGHPNTLRLNKKDGVDFAEDQFSDAYTITNNGGNHVDVEFVHGGPIMFIDSAEGLPINTSIPLEANGTYLFKVKVASTSLNQKNWDSNPSTFSWVAEIKTKETIPAVFETVKTETPIPTPPLVWYDIEVVPRYQEDPKRSFLTYATKGALDDEEVELHQQVQASVYLRKHELYNERVLLNGKLDLKHVTDIWPEGGFDVDQSYESADSEVHVTEVRTNRPSAVNAHLDLFFENLSGWGLQTAYTVTPVDVDTYVNANGGRLYTEIFLDSPGEPQSPPGGTSDDPNNLKGYGPNDPRRDKTDVVITQYSAEREGEGDPTLR